MTGTPPLDLVALSNQWAPLRPTTVYTAGLSPRTRSDIAYRLETGDRVAIDTAQENVRHPEHEYAQLEAIRRVAIKRRARVALAADK